MSKWIKAKDDRVELSADHKTVEVYLGNDDQGSQYLELDAEHLRNILSDGFFFFVASAHRFLSKYPEKIFTGSSGDSGCVFVVGLRKLLKEFDINCKKEEKTNEKTK